jgi:hypothetical protein
MSYLSRPISWIILVDILKFSKLSHFNFYLYNMDVLQYWQKTKHTYLQLFVIFINNGGTFMYCNDVNLHTDFWLYKHHMFAASGGVCFCREIGLGDAFERSFQWLLQSEQCKMEVFDQSHHHPWQMLYTSNILHLTILLSPDHNCKCTA